MFPITSFTASLGHDGKIDIFALALSTQAQPGQGVSVFRIRPKKAGGEWHPWAPAGNPATELSGCAASPTARGTKCWGPASEAHSTAIQELCAALS
jgi:hypothetical protein